MADPGYVANTFNQWQNLPPFGIGINGAVTQGGGGSLSSAGPMPYFRDALDAQRSVGGNFTPEASFPDGYLGTIRSRRDDRLLDSLKSRQNQHSYQRGVHKGERQDPAAYFWPSEYQPDAGLRREATTRARYAPLSQYDQVYSPKDWAMAGAENGLGISPPQKALRRLGPSWR